ncbi:hypothetical protein [Sporomusa acidovorans]|uniref:Uncharacterized protein n=1 Tax=Sporomusa acidovorans (strain ATCC 49682 / DSM 3132 / Mol) TaxID=1123286 RepID=A0ABZ3IX05_SPOA4|nr:hypothetical protein [Sporomusa acidovorans]OZC23665.1 hypothetical protein SPACI_05670 [Sporomusa acidovorans DSM 3132]SDE24329.1 hypothetical protein SAMN04488499_101093 [Sporomusa acidovorans]
MDKKQYRIEMLQSESIAEKHKRAVRRAGRLYRQLSADLTAGQLQQLNILMECWDTGLAILDELPGAILRERIEPLTINYALIVTKSESGQVISHIANVGTLKPLEVKRAMTNAKMIAGDKFRLAVKLLPFAAG